MASVVPKLKSDIVLKTINATARALKELKKVDPRNRHVLIYPNSETVHVGLGLNLLNIPPAEAVFDQANDLLNFDLRKLCLQGPKKDLYDSLVNRSLATYVTSHATMAKLEYEKPEEIQFCKAAGGVGVGFVNSLVFSGAMTFEDGLHLVRRQAVAMEKAAKVVPNAKLRVHLRPATHKGRVCKAAMEHCVDLGIPEEVAICSITKQLSPHIVEIAGHEEAIKFLEKNGTELFEFREMKRAVNIPHAYHTDLMRPVRDYLHVYIDHKIKKNPDYLKEPSTCSVYSATAGYRLRSIKDIKKDLCDYPIKPILIEQLFHCLFARPQKLAQPNIYVLWDRNLLKNLSKVNRLAYEQAKLLS